MKWELRKIKVGGYFRYSAYQPKKRTWAASSSYWVIVCDGKRIDSFLSKRKAMQRMKEFQGAVEQR